MRTRAGRTKGRITSNTGYSPSTLTNNHHGGHYSHSEYTEKEILNCPFCGAEGEQWFRSSEEDIDIRCTNKDCYMHCHPIDISTWNKRTPLPDQVEPDRGAIFKEELERRMPSPYNTFDPSDNYATGTWFQGVNWLKEQLLKPEETK